MKCVFQLVKRSDGTRCEAISIERDVFAADLNDRFPRALFDEYYVLVLYEAVGFMSKRKFSTYPMLTVGSFINLYGSRLVAPPEQPVVKLPLWSRLLSVGSGDNRKE